MRLGVDYYPEHWPESRWPIDARLMAEAGISVVRLAEFAWSRMEPKENKFDFKWLDKAIGILAKEGIQVVLGTPTASPPAWLMAKYPDTYSRDEYGHIHGFGTRQHRCHTPENYRKRSRAITTAMAKHYGKNQHVIGWQTDNEFFREDCTCDECAKKWHKWLKKKYKTLDKLNAAWGTVFWSQEYSDWSQIQVLAHPRAGNRYHSPSFQLDWRRFQSENAVSFQHEQVEILRKYAPKQFVTHNFMGFFDGLNYYDLAKDLDFVAWDNYPGEGPAGAAHDVMRGILEKNFWIMEERSGHIGWDKFSPAPRPGEIRMWTWEAVAHGADVVSYFRWRSCLYGTEQFWQGILNHDAVPRRRYHEIAKTGAEFKKLSPVIDGTAVKNEVAVLNDYENIWALDIQPQTEGFSFRKVLLAYTKALARLGVGADVIGPDADFKRYKLIVFPPLYVLTDEMAKKISQYVQAGGTIVLNCRTGVKNEINVCRTEPLPGPLARVAGLEISDYDCAGPRSVDIECSDGKTFKASLWCDVLQPQSAEPVAVYRSHYYVGEPAAAMNKFGKGRAYYVGFVAEDGFYTHLMKQVLDEVGVKLMADLPEGVELLRRVKNGREVVFVINFTAEVKKINLPGSYDELLSSRKVKDSLELKPFDVAVLK